MNTIVIPEILYRESTAIGLKRFMNLWRWIPAFAGMTILMSTGIAQSATLPDVLAHLEAKEKSVQTIQLQFEQDILFSQTGQSAHIEAEAYFGKAGRLRIQKRKPDQQLTVSDGKTVWVYNPGPQQVWRGAASSWLKAGWMPKGLVPLSGYVGELKKNFDLTVANSSDTAHVTLDATPKDPRLGYKLQFVFSTETWLPTKTIYVSDSARVTTVLSDVTVNPANAARQFQFPIPKGATVIPLN
jgi:outer membrane lipoprotein carrier protein